MSEYGRYAGYELRGEKSTPPKPMLPARHEDLPEYKEWQRARLHWHIYLAFVGVFLSCGFGIYALKVIGVMP